MTYLFTESILRRKRMTPFSFEWKWIADYFIFMGFLYLALTIIGCGIAYCLIRTWLDLRDDENPMEIPAEISYRSRYSEY
jgi:hypothetical protein